MDVSNPSMLDIVWAIRDARGLTTIEKSVAYAIASRGKCWAAADIIAADAGIARSAYYRARKRLIDLGVLVEEVREGETTVYEVAFLPLAAMKPNTPPSTKKAITVNDDAQVSEEDTTGTRVPSEHGGVFPENTGVCSEGTHKDNSKSYLEEELEEKHHHLNLMEVSTGGTEMKKTADDIKTRAPQMGFHAIANWEAADVAKVAQNSSLEAKVLDRIIDIYLQRRGLPQTDKDFVKGVGFLRWMIANPEAGLAWAPKPVESPTDVRNGPQAQGGRRVETF